MKLTLNPFQDVLWNRNQLKRGERATGTHKNTEVFNFFKLSKTFLNQGRQGSLYDKKSMKKIDKMIEEYRGRYDLPFDELYHKEKALVGAVVQADRALKDKEKNFKSLVDHLMIHKQEVSQIERETLLNEQGRSVLEQTQANLSSRLNKAGEAGGKLSSNVAFLNSKQQELLSLVD